LARLQCLEREGQIRPVTEVVVEVPLRRWTDVRGSKISLVDSIVATSQLLQMRWRYRSGKRDRAETVQKAPDTKTFL
jgi:predicted Abi (CAAX) family protease